VLAVSAQFTSGIPAGSIASTILPNRHPAA
jgi:hypothetical protein